MSKSARRRGYVPAVAASDQLAKLADDLAALDEMQQETARKIGSIAERQVTHLELRRDWGFTASALDLLDKLRWLCATRTDGRKGKRYNLRNAHHRIE